MARPDPRNKQQAGLCQLDVVMSSGKLAIREGTIVVVEFNRYSPDSLIFIWDESMTYMLYTFQSLKDLLLHIDLYEEEHAKTR